jgi:Skp family chaperone for outer membrane proteins
MNYRYITVTAFCMAILMNNTVLYTEDKNQSVSTKKETNSQKSVLLADPLTGRSVTAITDILTDRSVVLDATTVVVDSYVVMGECAEGLKARKEIERKKDFASQEIQEESKVFEKAKADYVSKSTTMSDAARDKEEKKLMKMERDLKNLVAEKEEELKHDMQVATEMLAQSLEAGVTKLAQSENIDIVFDKMTGRAIYVSDKFNFTDKAIKEVNKNYEIKLAHNKQAEAEAETTKIADNKSSSARSAKAHA